MKNIYELSASYDNRKSFYGKAMVKCEDGVSKLYSYDTLVAQIKDNKAIVFGTYSNSTLRHIKEFLMQNGFKAETKSQIEEDYMIKEVK